MPTTPNTFDLRKKFLDDCMAMLRYLLNNGKEVSTSLVSTVLSYVDEDAKVLNVTEEGTIEEVPSMDGLIDAYNSLVKSVNPATPESIIYLEKEEAKWSLFSFLSRNTFVRQLIGATLFFMILMIGLATSGQVQFTGKLADFPASGLPLLANLFFLMAAAGLGSSFHELYEAQKYTVNRTFLPKYISSYWARLVLGLIAGMLLAIFIPLPELGADFLASLATSTVAIIGGFASSFVYMFMNKLVDTANQFIGEKPAELEDAEKAAATANQKLEEQKSELARYLAELQGLVDSEADGDNIKATIKKMMDKVLPSKDKIGEDPKKVVNAFMEEFSEDEEKFRQLEYILNVDGPIERLKEKIQPEGKSDVPTSKAS